MTDKSSQSDFLITVAGLPGTWSRMSGGNPSGSNTKDRDGGATKPDILPGFVDYSQVTVTRAYSSSRDFPLAKKLLQQVNQLQTTVRRADLTRAKVVRPNTAITYSGLLAGVSLPDVDSNGNGTGDFTLTFDVSDVS